MPALLLEERQPGALAPRVQPLPLGAQGPTLADAPALAPASVPPLAPPDAQALRRLMKGGSKTFFAASLLLPPRVRAPATALYAFCRLADDAIDLDTRPHERMRELHGRLDALFAGRPGTEPADVALADVVHRHAMPRAVFDALLEGFLWDAEGRRYETLADLQAYGARVAGTVGAMMALVMGARTRSALARACELGVAMQLTNIARDVGEDARNGRLYLPRQWLREAGLVPEAWLAAPTFTPALASVTTRLLQAADELYARAQCGIAELPLDCRPAIQAASFVYAEIGHQLRREGLDSVSRRAVVSPRRKIALIGLALAHTTGRTLLPAMRAETEPPPLPAIRFLVEAAATTPAPATVAPTAEEAAPSRPRRPPRRSFDESMEWASDLYARLLEHDQRAMR